jgi:hypothetical protein
VRSREYRQAQRGRLQQIVSADRDQAPANKRDVGRRVEIQQLAERIDEEHVDR